MNNSLPPGFQLEDQPANPVPQGQMGPGPTSSGLPPGFDLEENIYGSVPQQALAGAEAVAGGATLGGSRVLENKLGLTTPEAQKRRQEQNPVTSTLGEIVGTGGLLLGTGGLGPLVEGAGTAAKLGAMAAEGGILGAGSAASDYAMGDPNLNAQKLLSYIGTGAVLGGGLGALFEGAGPVIAAGKERAASLKKAIGNIYGGTEKQGAVAATDALEAGDNAVFESQPSAGVKEDSLKQMQERVDAAKYSGNAKMLPQQDAAQKAANNVAMSNPINPWQMESLGSQEAQNVYGAAREMPGKAGELIRANETLQRNELLAKTDNAIQSIAGAEPVTSDAVKGGNVASDYLTDLYQGEKKASGELINQAKQLNTSGVDHLNGVLDAMSNAVPQIGKIVNRTAEGVEILPYKTSMGLSKQTYGAIKDAVKSLEENPQNFSDLFNIRKGLENGVNMFTSDAATQSEIRGLKSAMMDYMQGFVKDTPLMDGFRRYAVNEENGQIIKKAFGADLNDSYETALSKVKPEQIGDNIFRNTATVNAAKQILPRDQFDHILGNWLAENRALVTKDGVFSSNQFGNFLKNKQDALGAAFSDNPQALNQIKDINTLARLFPDKQSINPSGTAKTLAYYFKDVHGLGDLSLAVGKFLKDKSLGKLQDMVANENINRKLAGRAANFTIKDAIGDAIQKVTGKIDTGAASIFKGNSGDVVKGALIPSAVDHYEKNVKRVQQLNNDQSSLMDHLNSMGDILYTSAPHISNGLNAAVINSVQFLNSKLPKPNSELPFSEAWEPTQSQKTKFNRYFEAVDNPLIALKQIKNGSLSNETMESLQAVHPDLLQEMRSKVMDNINPKKKDLSYGTQIALSKFLGQPMNNSMLPQAIAANQVALMGNNQQQNQAQPGRKKGSTLGGLKELKRSQLAQTQTQELEEGT